MFGDGQSVPEPPSASRHLTARPRELWTGPSYKSIYFPNEDPALRLTLPLPQLPYQVVYLANALLPYSESYEFQPCLLWMTDWGIMGEVSERVAKSLVESFRSARGERNLLIETPAHLFGETEATDAQTLLTIAIVFGWDCYIIPKHGKSYVFWLVSEPLGTEERTPLSVDTVRGPHIGSDVTIRQPLQKLPIPV